MNVVACPFCKYTVEIDVIFAKKNGRVFCGTCCKSFEIFIKEDEPETEEVKEKTVEEKFNDGVEEILKDDDSDDIFWF